MRHIFLYVSVYVAGTTYILAYSAISGGDASMFMFKQNEANRLSGLAVLVCGCAVNSLVSCGDLERENFSKLPGDVTTVGQKCANRIEGQTDKTLLERNATSRDETQEWHEDFVESSKFCLVSLSTQRNLAYTELTERNHADYANQHGYFQQFYRERISGNEFLDEALGSVDSVIGGGLFWQKVAAVRNILAKHTKSGAKRSCEWVVWLDADTVITDSETSLETIVARSMAHDPNKQLDDIHVILSSDTLGPVNAGVFFIKNTAEGRGFVEATASLYHLYKDKSLPEQAAMTALAFSGHKQENGRVFAEVHANVMIVPQRIFNSFGPDPQSAIAVSLESCWQQGDFIAHFAGLQNSRREVLIRDILKGT